MDWYIKHSDENELSYLSHARKTYKNPLVLETPNHSILSPTLDEAAKVMSAKNKTQKFRDAAGDIEKYVNSHRKIDPNDVLAILDKYGITRNESARIFDEVGDFKEKEAGARLMFTIMKYGTY